MKKMSNQEIEEWVFWWACFLDLNDDYYEYCEARAANDIAACERIQDFVGDDANLAELYEDWGELFSLHWTGPSDPAWKAWFNQRRGLFLDTALTETVVLVENIDGYVARKGHVLLDIPLSMTRNDIEQQVRVLLGQYRRADNKADVIPAKYKLYDTGTRTISLTQIETAYGQYTSGDRGDQESAKKLRAPRQGSRLDISKKERLKDKIVRGKKSWEDGNEFSNLALCRKFPCRRKWHEDDRNNVK